MEHSNTNYRFSKDDHASWFPYLTNYGYVALTDVITKSECDDTLKDIRRCLAEITPNLHANDESSFGVKNNYLTGMEDGINYVIAHPKFLWDLRERVAPIFARLFECNVQDLVTSFGSFTYADGRREFEGVMPLDHLHTDQSPGREDFWMAQGQLNLVDSNEQAGGLIVFPGSHKDHKEIHKTFGLDYIEGDLYEFASEETDQLKGRKHLKLCPNAGDLVLFDSRILHSYSLPEKPCLRACVFECQVPRKNIIDKNEVLKARADAWEKKICSKHYPGDKFEAFPLFEVYRNERPLSVLVKKMAIKDAEMSEIQKSLLYVSNE